MNSAKRQCRVLLCQVWCGRKHVNILPCLSFMQSVSALGVTDVLQRHNKPLLTLAHVISIIDLSRLCSLFLKHIITFLNTTSSVRPTPRGLCLYTVPKRVTKLFFSPLTFELETLKLFLRHCVP